MARERWTLALIILCLSILVTVITAFRVRDLPRNQETKVETKKVQQCVSNNCDVKVGIVHSIKIESDKYSKIDGSKKVVHDKQRQLNEKTSGNKPSHRYEIRSDDDDDDDDDDDLDLFKFKTGVVREISKEQSDTKSKTINKVNFKVENDKDDDNDDNDDDEDDEKISEKTIVKPLSQQTKVTEKTKFTQKNNNNLVSSNKKESHENDSDDDDDDNDDDDDVDDDDYNGLDNLEELFKILDIQKKPKKENKETKATKKETKNDKLKRKDSVDKLHLNSDTYDDDDDDDDVRQMTGKKFKEEMGPQPSVMVIKEKPKIELKAEHADSKLDKKESKAESKSPEKKSEVKKEQPQEVKEPVKSIKNKEPEKKTDGKNKDVKQDLKDNKAHLEMKPKDESTIKNKGTEDISKHADKHPELQKHKVHQEVKQPKTEIKGENSVSTPTPPKDTVKHTKPKSEEVKDNIKEQKKRHEKESDEIENEYKMLKKLKEKGEEAAKSKRETKTKETSAEMLHTDEKNEDYLKHVTDALHRRNLLKSEFEDFYAFFPTFAPNFSRIHNPECRRHGLIVMRQLRGTKLWALNMLDATAKIPSGVLQGNGIQLGDFDQCIESRARVQLDTGTVVKVQGKYCLARVDVKAEHTELEAPVYHVQAKSLIRSKIDDPGHFVPRFSTLSWGVCVPSACNPQDVEVIIKDAIKHYQHTSGVVIKAKVDEEDCYTDDRDGWEEWLELPTVLTLSFYCVIVLLVLIATIQDFLARRQSDEVHGDDGDEKAECDQKDDDEKGEEKKPSESFITSFSLYRSVDKLMAPGTSDEISCIHGIRAIATLALLVAHKFLPVGVMPYTNRIRITEIVSSPIWSWCRAGWIFTDCFLLLSGTLMAHRIASESDSGAMRRIISKYLRFTPALLAVVLFYAYVWDKLSAGPMWGTFVRKNAEVCQQGWWWNLLYIQNYFGFEDMCAPQTHQLALDMQLNILGGVVIWALQSEISFMRFLLPALHLISAYLRYTTVRDHRLTLLAYHGVSVSQLYRTARLSYMSTIHRCSPYLIGISLGLALKNPSKHGKFILTLGWLTSIFLWALVIWAGLDSGYTNYRYNVTFAAQYATIAPVASAMGIAWVIYAVHTGTCGFLSDWLCCRPLVLISRLSYALYLTQFIIFITSIGTVKTSREFTLVSLVDVHEIIGILVVSIVLTLTFVNPMQNLHKIFTFKSKLKAEEEKEEESETKTAEETNEEVILKEEPQIQLKRSFLAHREVLEEIPEMEVEYENQREVNEGLDEILEEEEEEDATIGEDEEIPQLDNDLEIIEEEEAGEEDSWIERQRLRDRISGDNDRELDEWEWTNGNGRSGAQYYRYGR